MKRLIVRIIGGRQFLHGNNPYVKFLWRGQKHKTSPAKGATEPKWGDQFILDYDDKEGSGDLSIGFLIWHDKVGKNTQLGRVDVNLSAMNLVLNDAFKRQEAKIQEGVGYLEYEIRLTDPDAVVTQPATAPAAPYAGYPPPAAGAYPPHGYPQGPPQGYPYGQPPQAYPPQAYPQQAYPPQAYGQPQAYPPQQAYPPPQAYPPQAYGQQQPPPYPYPPR